MTYCEFVHNDTGKLAHLHRRYHDEFYGFPLHSDNELFGRFILEINQAGLSWGTILAKEEAFESAFDGFDIAKIAAYEQDDIDRLLNNPGIIRNKLKINAVIYNAKQVMQLKQDYGSFKGWIDAHHPLTLEQWVKLFKKHFKFVGPEIVNEFLMSTAYLPGAHDEDCPVLDRIKKLDPPWLKSRPDSNSV